MSESMGEVVKRWYGSAAQERAEIYAYVSLKPVKKTTSYRLVIDKLAVLNGSLKDLSDALTTAFREGPEHKAYTVFEPKNSRYDRNKKDENPKPVDSFNAGVPFYKLYGINTIVLSQNSNLDLECYVVQDSTCVKIPFVIEDESVKKQISDHINRDGNATLSVNHYAAVTAALAKQGYQLDSNSIFAQIESRLEKHHFLGQPILKRDEVNFLNAYLSWYDFFNDIKAVVVKRLTVLFLTLKNVFTMIYRLYAGANLVLRGQEGGVEQFDLAAQSLTKALVYALMTWKLLMVIAQLLSIASRIMMSIPGILTSIPETIRACTQDGCLKVVRRGFPSFARRFWGMFSTIPPQDAAAVNPNFSSNAANTAEQNPPVNQALDLASLRLARELRFGGI